MNFFGCLFKKTEPLSFSKEVNYLQEKKKLLDQLLEITIERNKLNVEKYVLLSTLLNLIRGERDEDAFREATDILFKFGVTLSGEHNEPIS
jgi:hypothetical protein